MAEYKSKHTGAQIDAAVDRAKAAILTVNGTAPDASGNVVVSGGGDGNIYEHIETVEVTEDAKVSRTAEPDGTPYNFAGVLVMFESTAAAQSEDPTLVFVGPDGNYMSFAIGTFTGNTTTRYAFARGEMIHGLWRKEWGNWTTNLNASLALSHTMKEMLNNTTVVQFGSIVKVNTNKVMPAGSKMHIWGLRK